MMFGFDELDFDFFVWATAANAMITKTKRSEVFFFINNFKRGTG
jgi:hypothetical protein